MTKMMSPGKLQDFVWSFYSSDEDWIEVLSEGYSDHRSLAGCLRSAIKSSHIYSVRVVSRLGRTFLTRVKY